MDWFVFGRRVVRLFVLVRVGGWIGFFFSFYGFIISFRLVCGLFLEFRVLGVRSGCGL